MLKPVKTAATGLHVGLEFSNADCQGVPTTFSVFNASLIKSTKLDPYTTQETNIFEKIDGVGWCGSISLDHDCCYSLLGTNRSASYFKGTMPTDLMPAVSKKSVYMKFSTENQQIRDKFYLCNDECVDTVRCSDSLITIFENTGCTGNSKNFHWGTQVHGMSNGTLSKYVVPETANTVYKWTSFQPSRGMHKMTTHPADLLGGFSLCLAMLISIIRVRQCYTIYNADKTKFMQNSLIISGMWSLGLFFYAWLWSPASKHIFFRTVFLLLTNLFLNLATLVSVLRVASILIDFWTNFSRVKRDVTHGVLACIHLVLATPSYFQFTSVSMSLSVEWLALIRSSYVYYPIWLVLIFILNWAMNITSIQILANSPRVAKKSGTVCEYLRQKPDILACLFAQIVVFIAWVLVILSLSPIFCLILKDDRWFSTMFHIHALIITIHFWLTSYVCIQIQEELKTVYCKSTTQPSLSLQAKGFSALFVSFLDGKCPIQSKKQLGAMWGTADGWSDTDSELKSSYSVEYEA